MLSDTPIYSSGTACFTSHPTSSKLHLPYKYSSVTNKAMPCADGGGGLGGASGKSCTRENDNNNKKIATEL